MKRLAILILVGLIAVQLAVIGGAKEMSSMKDVFEVMYSRKSVRNFTGKAVTKDELDKIVRAGMAAPTAVNMQPWSFVIVTERKKLDELASGLPYAKMLEKAGAAIIVCAEPKSAFNRSAEFAIIDATLASENILLAIEALGLGAVWTASYPEKERMEHVRKVLNIPEDIIPLNVIPVGQPAGDEKPKNKYKKDKIHWDKW